MENPISNIHSIYSIENDILLSSITPYLFFGYVFISTLLLIRFLNSLIIIWRRIYTNSHIKNNDNTTVILLEEVLLPHTFFNYVFINREDYFSKKISNELFTHELTHANQKHTIDILVAELFQIVFWFNPVSFAITRAIKLNHEFIADDKVIKTYHNRSEYQKLLLNIATRNKQVNLTSSVNYAITKHRFLMMGKSTSSRRKNILKISIIPLLIFMLFLFANITQSSDHSEGAEHHFSEEHTWR